MYQDVFELGLSIMATVHMRMIHNKFDMIYVTVIARSLSWRNQPSMMGQHVDLWQMWLMIMDWGEFPIHGEMKLDGLCNNEVEMGGMEIL